ncbi:MAG: MFS transporter, partial [Planctomycetaceae bacterium]|nr:MFS transporter [Planctomycetaceae bacterium]
IVFLVVFIDLLGFGIVLPLLPRYGDYFHADRLALGGLMAAFSAMQFLFAPLWGRLSDRFGRRPVLMVGLAGSVLFYGLFGYVSAWPPETILLGLGPIGWMMITRIGAGIAGATIPTAQAYIADSTGERERGKGMAMIGAAFGLGFTFGPLLAAAFASDNLGDPPSSAPGYLASGLAALALLGAVFLLPESLHPESRPAGRDWLKFGSLGAALVKPAIGPLLITMFLVTFAFAQFESTLSLLTEALGMSEQDNFYVFAYLGLILTLAQGLLVRRLLPRIGENQCAIVGAVLLTIGFLLVGATAPEASSESAETLESGGRAMLFGVLPVSVVGFAMLTPALQSLLSLKSAAGDQGGVLGLGQSMSAMARILGPVVGIALVKTDPRYPFWSAALTMVLGILLVLSVARSGPDPVGELQSE